MSSPNSFRRTLTSVFRGKPTTNQQRLSPLGRAIEELESRWVPATATFDYTGAIQTWTVPIGVTSATFDIFGAQGADGGNSNFGLGGRAQVTLAVTPGEVLAIYVGGAASGTNGGFNGGANTSPSPFRSGGGGGGGSDIRRDANHDTTYALDERLLVAGGAAGAAGSSGVLVVPAAV
jgi:hypothetical protein